MKAQLFLPALFLFLGLGAPQITNAQEIGLTFAKGSARVDLSLNRGGLSATAGSSRSRYGSRHGSSYGRSRSYGHGSSRGRRVQRSYRDSQHVCTRRPIWVPGHFETRVHDVFVPPRHVKVWIDAIYQDGLDERGRHNQVLVRAGRWDVIDTPGYFEPRREQVWVAGRNEFRNTCGH